MEKITLEDLDKENIRLFFENSEVRLLRYFEPAPGLFVCESPKVIRRALAAGYKPVSALVSYSELHKEGKELLEAFTDINVYDADRSVLDYIKGFNMTNGFLCLMRRKELPSVEEVCKNARRIVVIDNVENPTNVGAIFRNAAALNMDAVLLTKGSSDPLYKRAARVSMGTVFGIPWTFIDEDVYITKVNELGFKTVAMALTDDSIDIKNPELKSEEKLCIIMGNEGEGLPKHRISLCDYTVKIPMSKDVDSLNVAAASALAFWELS